MKRSMIFRKLPNSIKKINYYSMKSSIVISILFFNLFFANLLNAQIDMEQIIKDALNAHIAAKPVINLFNAQVEKKQDYVTSGYYQLVYEADIAHWEGKDSLAYKKLQAAESACNLLNQYKEMELYIILLFENKNLDRAIYYMEKLAMEYGKSPYQIHVEGGELGKNKDSIFVRNLLAEYPALNDSILPAIIQKYNEFYTPEREKLSAEWMDILNSDQAVREDFEIKKETNYLEAEKNMKETDIKNAGLFFEILKKYGYPNIKRYGEKNAGLFFDPLIMHISDHFNIEEMILQYVHAGECEPDLYGIIIDRKDIFFRREKCSYAAYNNIKDEQIADIDHLDERRLAIGMPTREMKKKRNELLTNIYEKENRYPVRNQ
jgi:hypothetical protein